MAFRKKVELILAQKPDLLIIPECEECDRLTFPAYGKPIDKLWFGKNRNKGLGIFSFCDLKFKVLDCHNPELRTVIPILVSNGQFEFTLFAIWANNPNDKQGRYIEQVGKALDHYSEYIKPERTILIGDFNSNAIWDKTHKQFNHSKLVQHLEQFGIQSTYHTHHVQKHGNETHATFYLYRKKDKGYHIDYCFVSKDLLAKVKSVEIGEHEHWKSQSDHVPLIVTFESLDVR